jgi:hypothetical protein
MIPTTSIEIKLDTLLKQVKEFKVKNNSLEGISELSPLLHKMIKVMNVEMIENEETKKFIENYSISFIRTCIEWSEAVYPSLFAENKKLIRLKRRVKYALTVFKTACQEYDCNFLSIEILDN